MACRFITGSPSDSSTVERARVSLRNSSALVDARAAGTRAAALRSSDRKLSSSRAISRKPSSSDSAVACPEATSRYIDASSAATRPSLGCIRSKNPVAPGVRHGSSSSALSPIVWQRHASSTNPSRKKRQKVWTVPRRIDQDRIRLTVVEYQNRIGIQDEAVFVRAPRRLSAHNRFNGKRTRIIADIVMASVSREDYVRISARSVFRIDHGA